MENLNAKQIKKALEEMNVLGLSPTAIKKAIAIISSQEQDKEKLGLLIDELEKEKRELFEENKRLTEENEAWQMQLISQEEKANKAYYDLACEVENERLRAAAPECVEKVYRFMLRYVDKLSEIEEIDITIRLGQIAKEMLEGINERDFA